MVQYAFTPWRNSRELLAVRRQFYPDLVDGKRKKTADSREAALQATQQSAPHRAGQQSAVARVSVWMQRGHCPHMVESTALLVAAALSDSAESPAARMASYAVRAAYAAAFSRFVTGLLDGQQDRARKLSMYSLARAIGLPAAFVELRHQATHESLPSLARLRAAARRALLWIWQYYWMQLGPVGTAADAARAEAAEVEEAAAAGVLGSEPATKLAVRDSTESVGENLPAVQSEEARDTDRACREAVLGYVDDTAAAAEAAAKTGTKTPQADSADWELLAGYIQTWGEARVLSVLSAVSPADGNNSRTRVLRCIRLSQMILQHGKNKPQSKPKPKPKPRPDERSQVQLKLEEQKRWTPDNVDLDDMRATLERGRQALYRPHTDATDGENCMDDGDNEQDGEDDAMVVDSLEAPAEQEPETPAPRPQWTRYEGDWKPRPIGVV